MRHISHYAKKSQNTDFSSVLKNPGLKQSNFKTNQLDKGIFFDKERFLWSTFIALFSISVLLLLTSMDSFTAMISCPGSKSCTTQIAESCQKTIPSSVSCEGGLYGKCANTHSQQY